MRNVSSKEALPGLLPAYYRRIAGTGEEDAAFSRSGGDFSIETRKTR